MQLLDLCHLVSALAHGHIEIKEEYPATETESTTIGGRRDEKADQIGPMQPDCGPLYLIPVKWLWNR